MEKFKFLPKDRLQRLPKNPGVYALKNGGKFLYIGKAFNIKGRVKNHFSKPAYRDNLFLNQVQKVGFLKTDSEIEALLLEAKLIKKYQPKYNILWRDDKNFFHVGITKETFPRVFLTHQPKPKATYLGPFVEGRPIKQTLRLLRKVFPYYTVKNHAKTPCLYCQINLCPGPHPDIKEYKKNIKNLVSVLKGKKKSVLQKLKKEMRSASWLQDFEKAAQMRDQISSLERVFSHATIFEEIREDDWRKTQKIFQGLLKIKREISRIEAYDISNIQGKQATGSMITFIKGAPNKNFYRKFKIRIEEKPNDIAMIKETLSRRLKHPEWPFPDVILIDGGKAQLNAAQLTITNHQLPIPVIALAKKKNELYLEDRKKPILLKTLPREIFNLILRLRDEAHRFAIIYHRKLRKKALIGS